MEYAKDSAFVKDFVLRTKENIHCGNHPYEVTQLVNSLVGLLILPKERYYANIQDNMIDAKLLADIRAKIKITTPPKYCSLKYIVRRMRNAIAHFHIVCKADKYTHEIDEIIFSDFDECNNGRTPNFQIALPVDLVQRFVEQFSDAVSQSITD